MLPESFLRISDKLSEISGAPFYWICMWQFLTNMEKSLWIFQKIPKEIGKTNQISAVFVHLKGQFWAALLLHFHVTSFGILGKISCPKFQKSWSEFKVKIQTCKKFMTIWQHYNWSCFKSSFRKAKQMFSKQNEHTKDWAAWCAILTIWHSVQIPWFVYHLEFTWTWFWEL